jgi:hypothetical protein
MRQMLRMIVATVAICASAASVRAAEIGHFDAGK